MSRYLLIGTGTYDGAKVYVTLDLKKYTTINTDEANMINTLRGGAKVDGIGLNEKGAIVGTNGALSRYPEVDLNTGTLLKNNALIVVGKTSNNKFICSDYKGTTVIFTEQEAINFINTEGNSIANGKLVTKDNKQFISSIVGEYMVVAMPDAAKEVELADDRPTTQAEAIADIKKSLRAVAKEVIRRGSAIRDYDAVGDAMIEAGICYTYQLRDKQKFEKIVNLAIEKHNLAKS